MKDSGGQGVECLFSIEPHRCPSGILIGFLKTAHIPESLSLLRHYGIASVIADSGGRFVEAKALTSPTVYLRFHGRGGLYSSPYSIDQLTSFACKITVWLAEGRQVWAFFNNDIV
jgi:uncharacterized protein YecE (DUF72 family)